MPLETDIQTTIINRVRSYLANTAIRVIAFGDTEDPDKSGHPWIEASILCAHTQSRSTVERSTPYTEREILSYLWRIDFRGDEPSAIALVSSVKSAIRGYQVIDGQAKPFVVEGSGFKGFENGIWTWEIDSSVEVLRRQGEIFQPVPDPIEIPNLTISAGVWRSPIDNVSGDGSGKDTDLEI